MIFEKIVTASEASGAIIAQQIAVQMVPHSPESHSTLNTSNFFHFSFISAGIFFLVFRLIFYISICVHIYLTLSRQEDLESSYALCKVFGLTLFPIVFICLFMSVIGILSSKFATAIPVATLLVTLTRILIPIGIIMTNDDLRIYSKSKLSLCLNTTFHCLKLLLGLLKRFLCCTLNQNQIHVVVE